MKYAVPTVLFCLVLALPASATNSTLIHAAAKISVCGNGVREGGEHCDGAALGSMTCSSIGFSGGTLACSPSCEYNTSLCISDAISTAIPLFSANIGGNYTLSEDPSRSVLIALPPDFYGDDLRLQEFLYHYADIAPTAPAPSGTQFAGNVYDFVFINPDGGVISQLSKPVTMTLSYSDDDVAGLDEASIAPYRKESGASEWQAVSGASVNTTLNTVTFTADHFSSFTLIAPPVSSSGSSTSVNSGGGWGGPVGEPITTPAPEIRVTIPTLPIAQIAPYVNRVARSVVRPKARASKSVQIAPRPTASPKPIRYIAPIPAPKARKSNIVDSPCRFSCRFAVITSAVVDILKHFQYVLWRW